MNVGDIVEVRFLDHCTSHGESADPVEFLVFGTVSKVCDTHVVVMSWCNLDVEDEWNEEGYTIIRSCILGVRYLVPCDEVWDWEEE